MRLTRKEYTTSEEKKKDFWRGFGLWWAINVGMLLVLGPAIYAIWTAGVTTSILGLAGAFILPMLPFIVNIGLLIGLTMTRSQMALGALAAIAVPLVIGFIALPLITAVACFAAMGSSGSP